MAPLIARAVLNAYYYLNQDAASHIHLTSQYNATYVPIDVSLTGSGSSTRYAAIWHKYDTPVQTGAWKTINDQTSASFQGWINQYASSGLQPTAVTAAGSGTDARFAGIWGPTSALPDGCSNTMTIGLSQVQAPTDSSTSIISIKKYGTAGNWLYATIQQKCTTTFAAGHKDFYVDVPNDQAQATFNAEWTKPWFMPSSWTVGDDGTSSMVFTDRDTGNGWAGQLGVNATSVKSTIDNSGMTPYSLQAYGPINNLQYSYMVAYRYPPAPRAWSVATGATSGTGLKNPTDTATKLDSLFNAFMVRNSVRYAQMVLSRGGVPIMERAYSYTEPGRSTAQPSDKMLIQSISKAFCSATIHALIKQGKLTPSTAVFPRIGLTNVADPRMLNITVQQLLDHTAGFGVHEANQSPDNSFDPSSGMGRQIAAEMSNNTRMMTLDDMVKYTIKRQLKYTPCNQSSTCTSQYSNFGYCLLSYVAQKVGGYTTYYDTLYYNVLKPNNLVDATVWATAFDNHKNDNIFIEGWPWVAPSATTPASDAKVGSVWGGDGNVKEATAGAGGMSASATTLTKFLNAFSPDGSGPHAPGGVICGSGNGGSGCQWSFSNGLDVAWLFNTNNFYDGNLFNTLSFTDIPNVINNAV